MTNQRNNQVPDGDQLSLFAEQETDAGGVLGRPIKPEETVKMELEEAWQALGPCFVATKFDGYRVQIQRNGERVWLFTRKGQDWTERFPTVVDSARRQILADTVILDAELLPVDPISHVILPRSRIMEARNQAYKAVVFDVLYVWGRTVQTQPLQERLQLLRAIINQDAPVVLVPAEERLVSSFNDLKRLYDECVRTGSEGLILKSPISAYKAGERNRLRVKVKVTDTIDAVVLGFDLRSGQDTPDAITALLVGVYDQEASSFASIGKVGRGKLARAQWQELCDSLYSQRLKQKYDNIVAVKKPMWWVPPTKVVEIEGYGREESRQYAAGRTSDGTGYQLVNARIAADGIRHDKDPEDATTLTQFMAMRLAPGQTELQDETGDQMQLL